MCLRLVMLTISALSILVACALPAPSAPANPLVTLGARLFRERRLSGNGAQACVDCHQPALAFTDGRPTALGSTGEIGVRNSPSLLNVGALPVLGWARPDLTSLEAQAAVPLFGTHPVEMGATGAEQVILDRLRADPTYPQQFAAAFPSDPNPLRWEQIIRALAAYERTLVSGTSPYDRWLAGDATALTAAAQRGLRLFQEVGCTACHSGPLLTNSSYHNVGLYNLDGRGAYPARQAGLYDVTGQVRDMGRFRVPSLRNVARTAPYYHDGSAATLADVLDVYAAGGRGAGVNSPVKSPALVPVSFSSQDRADLLAFFVALSDDRLPP